MKLQKKGGGAPSREPMVDPETQKAMMAWHYKKQEEQKVSPARHSWVVGCNDTSSVGGVTVVGCTGSAWLWVAMRRRLR